MPDQPSVHFDPRFSDPMASAIPWEQVVATLTEAELYWLTTVRTDGRPHVTPLVGIWHDGAPHFCTGPTEQKARNLAANPSIALTTGTNRWKHGVDVVVEGLAIAVRNDELLRVLAAGYAEKYAGEWAFDVRDGSFTHPDGGTATVFRVQPRKLLVFTKDPHGQTTFRFDH